LKIECDFIVKKEGKLLAVQVVYDLNEDNYLREVRGLYHTVRKFNCD
jgi:hypothetical protein